MNEMLNWRFFVESGVTYEIAQVLLILVITAGLLVSSILRVDIVAMLVLVVLGATGLLPVPQLFSGFASEATMSMIGVMIISYGLDNSGVTVRIARWMLRLGKENPRQISLLLFVATGGIASFLRSLGTVSIFLPVANRISSRLSIDKSSLLLPMAFCALMGGTLTMVGASPLLLLNSLLKDAHEVADLVDKVNIERFSLFDVLPIGLTIFVTGLVYVFFISRNFAISSAKNKKAKLKSIRKYFIKTYNKGGEVHELYLTGKSELVGKTLKYLETHIPPSLSVLAVKSKDKTQCPPLRNIKFSAGDHVAIMGDLETIELVAKELKIILEEGLSVFSDLLHPSRSGLSECVIPPSSKFIGEKVEELKMRRNYDIHVLTLLRGNKLYVGDELTSLVLRAGDTMAMYSRWEILSEFQNQPDFVVITTSYPKEKQYNTKKIPQAIFFFLLPIILIVSGVTPLSVGLLSGAMGMILTGVLTIDEAYENISWQTIFLIGGLLPLGLVMQTSGAAEWMSNLVLRHFVNMPVWMVQLFLSVFTTTMALIISNVGATIMIIPLAINLGVSLGIEPRVLALIVALSACNTFLIPTHQVNALVAVPGGYKTSDFIRYGGIMTLIFAAAMLISVNLIYGT